MSNTQVTFLYIWYYINQPSILIRYFKKETNIYIVTYVAFSWKVFYLLQRHPLISSEINFALSFATYNLIIFLSSLNILICCLFAHQFLSSFQSYFSNIYFYLVLSIYLKNKFWNNIDAVIYNFCYNGMFKKGINQKQCFQILPI